MMQFDQTRRKRRRRPTITPRFGASSIALELGLLRMALEAQEDLERKEKPKRPTAKVTPIA